MSDFPGEMTKHSLSAPPRTRRSTRYSLTARGRSQSPSLRLTTGSRSFENASRWIRLPCPAAGTMPHIINPNVVYIGGDPCTPPGSLRSAHASSFAPLRSHCFHRRGGPPPPPPPSFFPPPPSSSPP